METKKLLPFLLVGFLAACNSPETPKARAVIDFEITQLPFTIYYDYWEDVWYADLTLLFTESGGVGATIRLVETTWLQNNAQIASTRVGGSRIAAFGSARVGFRTQFPAKYRPKTMNIEVTGTDDNGYAFGKKKSYTITWDQDRRRAQVKNLEKIS